MKEGSWHWEMRFQSQRKEGVAAAQREGRGLGRVSGGTWRLEGLSLPLLKALELPGFSGTHWFGWHTLGRGWVGKKEARLESEILEGGQG